MSVDKIGLKIDTENDYSSYKKTQKYEKRC